MIPTLPAGLRHGVLTGLLAFALSAAGCSQPERKEADAEATATTAPATTATTTTPTPSDTTTALQTEYRALALKNACRDDYKWLDGRWRFIGKTRTPDYSDILEINGTKFVEKLDGKPDGKRVTATIDGEIRCMFKNRFLIQADKVTPPGAYGNNAGDFYPCDLLGDMNGERNKMLLVCYFNWDLRTAAGLEFEYERVTTP